MVWLAGKVCSTRSQQSQDGALNTASLLCSFFFCHLLLACVEDERQCQLSKVGYQSGERFSSGIFVAGEIENIFVLKKRKRFWCSVEKTWVSQSNKTRFSSAFGVAYFCDTPLLPFSSSANISGVDKDRCPFLLCSCYSTLNPQHGPHFTTSIS